MAYSSYADPYQVAPSINRTIGCQDLLKDGACTHQGWLRRQSLRNRLKIFSWPQVYVVVSGGCVYCFSNETAKRPASAFSLYGYDRVYRPGEVTHKEATWTFKIVHINLAYRSYLFSASSEKEMVFWMKLLKKEMLRANGKLPRTQGDGKADQEFPAYQDAGSDSMSVNSSVYNDIESNIYEDSSNFNLPSNYTNKKEDDASDDEMDRVVQCRPDLQDRPPQPPPVPNRPGRSKAKVKAGAANPQEAAVMSELKQMNLKEKTRKTSNQSEKYAEPHKDPGLRDRGSPDGSSVKKEVSQQKQDGSDSTGDFWSSIFFYGGRDLASEIIRQIPDDGVYLVRVNEDKSKVLHVYCNDQPRKFQIFELPDKKLTLKKDISENFNRVEELIYYYYNHPLPGQRPEAFLTECYLHHPYYCRITATDS